MTRLSVYGAALVASLAASILTVVAIILPRWISWDSTTPSGTRIHYTYGLHRLCSSLTGSCRHFPEYEDCHGEDRYFCSMWRSVGWMMSFAVVLEGMVLVAYVVILGGGRQKREAGWKVLSFLLLLAAAVQCGSMAIVAYLYDHDDRFFPGWKLDTSWVLCTFSWSIFLLTAGAFSISAWVLPSEEMIRWGGGNRYPFCERSAIHGGYFLFDIIIGVIGVVCWSDTSLLLLGLHYWQGSDDLPANMTFDCILRAMAVSFCCSTKIPLCSFSLHKYNLPPGSMMIRKSRP